MNRLSLLSLLVGGVLPLLVATVTKASWPEPLKALLLAVFSALTGVGSALLNPTGADYFTIIANGALAFVSAAAVAAGTWRPTGALGKLESVFVRDGAPLLEGGLPTMITEHSPTPMGLPTFGTSEPPGPADHTHPNAP